MLFKAIYYGKEHRTPYSNKGMRRTGLYCLCDFSHNPKTQDSWFRNNRLYSNRKREVASYFNIREYGYVQSSFRIKNVHLMEE